MLERPLVQTCINQAQEIRQGGNDHHILSWHKLSIIITNHNFKAWVMHLFIMKTKESKLHTC